MFRTQTFSQLPQEDYLKRQMDQFAKALAKLLIKLSGLKNPVDITERTRITDEVFEKEGHISIKGLLHIPADHFVDDLLKTNQFNTEQLELLGEVLFSLSDGHHLERELLVRTLSILEHLHAHSNTYSLERQFRIEQIRKKIYP